MSLALACYCMADLINKAPIVDMERSKEDSEKLQQEKHFKVPIQSPNDKDKYNEDITWLIK